MGRHKKIKTDKKEVKDFKSETKQKHSSGVEDILKNLVKASGNEFSAIVSDGTSSDVDSYTDTGCYLLNAQISGSLFGGFPNSQILALSGESTTGKTFFSLSIIDNFLKKHDKGVVVIFDSENALNKNRLKERGVDISRIIHNPVHSTKDFTTQVVNIVDKINEDYKVGDHNFLLLLDSLGNLPSEKEIRDAKDSNNVADFTRTKDIRSAFRILIPKLSKHKIPFIVTNHSYANIMAFGGQQKMSGGGGIQYAADYILMLTKAKEKSADGQVVGAIISSTCVKNRDARENTKIKMILSYKYGLDKYFGLADYMVKYGFWKGEGSKDKPKYEVDGKLYSLKAVYSEAEKFFTEDVLKKLDEKIKGEFCYGTTGTSEGDASAMLDDDDAKSEETDE